jgi:hypothetical protein
MYVIIISATGRRKIGNVRLQWLFGYARNWDNNYGPYCEHYTDILIEENVNNFNGK